MKTFLFLTFALFYLATPSNGFALDDQFTAVANVDYYNRNAITNAGSTCGFNPQDGFRNITIEWGTSSLAIGYNTFNVSFFNLGSSILSYNYDTPQDFSGKSVIELRARTGVSINTNIATSLSLYDTSGAFYGTWMTVPTGTNKRRANLLTGYFPTIDEVHVKKMEISFSYTGSAGQFQEFHDLYSN